LSDLTWNDPLVTAHLLHHNRYFFLLKRYFACRTFSKPQPYSNESCLSMHTYTYKIKADYQLHNCICGALSIKMAALQIYL